MESHNQKLIKENEIL